MKRHPATMRLFASCRRLWNGLNPGTTATAERMRAALEVQTSAIFQCPEELFSEILSHFPVLRWADVHYLYLVWWRAVPDTYGDRGHVLLALSATCRAMRFRFLSEAWETVAVYHYIGNVPNRIPSRLQLRCRALVEQPGIAAHVRVMTVSLSYSRTDETVKDFAQCLPALPNLHTLEITSMENTHSQLLCVGLMTAVLPQIRTAILPPAAHHILRHCPNIEDLTCSWEGPNRQFFESLAVGKMKLKRFATLFPGAAVSLRRFAALLPGEADSWARLAEICPQIEELFLMHRIYDAWDERKCIRALKSLSAIWLLNYKQKAIPTVRYPGSSWDFDDEDYPRRDFKKDSENAWEDIKNVARDHLESCGGSGPKILRTRTVAYTEQKGVEYSEPEEEFV